MAVQLAIPLLDKVLYDFHTLDDHLLEYSLPLVHIDELGQSLGLLHAVHSLLLLLFLRALEAGTGMVNTQPMLLQAVLIID